MILKQFKNQFFSQLVGLYPETEIDSFFYILCEAYLNYKRVDIALNLHKDINIPESFNTAIADLIAQKPIQYITETAFFYDLVFFVNPSVLIPRPETEELVDWIMSNHSNKKQTILDIGTGSGCIAITLAKNIIHAEISALDVSSKALDIAKQNALKNNVSVHFIEDDILNPQKTENTWDVIVSNPPYIRNLEKTEIQPNVLENEPHLALFVDNDNPLIFYKAIADFALKHLSKKGTLYLEINQYLGAETVTLLKQKGFNNIILRKDIFDNDRMIKADLYI